MTVRANARRPTIVGSGLFALDVVVRREKRGAYVSLGGSAGNVLAILGYFGWTSVPVAMLGNDVAGSCIRREFQWLNADVRFLSSTNYRGTPMIFQTSEQGAHRFSFSCPNCGRRHAAGRNDDDVERAQVVESIPRPDAYYFDRVTSEIVGMAQIYRSRGSIIMFEPSAISEDTELFQSALHSAHIVKYADDRINNLDPFDVAGIDIEIHTLGARGLRYRTRSLMREWSRLGSLKAPHVVDTAGAGDWCSAGMLYRLTNQEESSSGGIWAHNSIHEALRFGQALATLNCMHTGARGLARRCASRYAVVGARRLEEFQPEIGSDDYSLPVGPYPAFIERIARSNRGGTENVHLPEIQDLCCGVIA